MSEVETIANLWRLGADPAALRAAASALRLFGAGAQRAAETVTTATGAVFAAEWTGTTAETYDAHRRKVTTDVEAVGGHFGAAALALETAAAALGTAQGALDDSRARLSAKVGATFTDDQVTVTMLGRDQTQVVIAEIQAASDIRADLDVTLTSQFVALEKLRTPLRTIGATWDGSTDWFTLPPEPDGTVFLVVDGTLIVDTGPGNDHVSVRVDKRTGERFLVVNGIERQIFDGMDLVIRAGGGNDEIDVPPGTPLRLTVLGGDGDDRIHGGDGATRLLGGAGDDRLYGGAAADRISGGAGDDYVDAGDSDDTVTGGAGDDVLYGMSGDDRVSGQSGADYLEGARGGDQLDGGAGPDVLSGGEGDDTLRGGEGDDRLYGGRGADTGSGGTGTDRAFTQSGDRVDAERAVTVEIRGHPGDTIEVQGSPEFVARVKADLGMLEGSPLGQEMLTAIDRAHDRTRAVAADWPVLGAIAYQGDQLTIREGRDEAGHARYDRVWEFSEKYEITYNPAYPGTGSSAGGRPLTILFHELAHVYDYAHDTRAPGTYGGAANPGAPNHEREAVGLPVDHDGDPRTPERTYPGHPDGLTENGMRRELGYPEREKY
ncbi:M91 family zinc metallopeptidase [Longispora urticae]